ncbi:MAG: hypothetical protein KDN22_22155 [Verrucomicrobiae bacterium]|nr:hypothetical protein [Verrucomicrobiae bacterium]
MAIKSILPKDQPFDYQLAMDRLAGYRFPRNKLSQLCSSGEIVRVKKGLFIPASPDSNDPSPVDPLVLAGLIYGPSYVSLETALARHGLIPERVTEITCMTTKRSRAFQTPIGRFSYHSINPCVFSYGMTIESAPGGTYFLATPEKATCDRLAQIKGIRAQRDIPSVIEEYLRIDIDDVLRFQDSEIHEIARRYRRNSVTTFAKWFSATTRSIV